MGESKKAFSADKCVMRRTHIGGQALIEGIMMRGRYNWAVAIRRPDGSIYTEEHDLASGRAKNAWLHLPIIRGCTAFVESLALGYKALNISAEKAYEFEEDDAEVANGIHATRDDAACDFRTFEPDCAFEPSMADITHEDARAVNGVKSSADDGASFDNAHHTKPVSGEGAEDEQGETSKGMGTLLTVSMIVGLVLGIVIFVVLPAFISNLVFGQDAMNTASWNIFDGLVRVAIFIAYIWLISLMKDIKRMFAYHGAEHKTIHCYEHGLELTPQNADGFPRLHVRCGTAFMIMVMIIAIFVYTALGGPINALVDMTGVGQGPLRFVLIVLTRIILMPVIAGVSYEITVKWAGKRPDNPLVKVILWPGMQMQRLTTNPPDEGMLECAIVAMNMVLAREEQESAEKGRRGHTGGERR